MEQVQNKRVAMELISLVPLMHKSIFHCGRDPEFMLPPKQIQTVMVLSFYDRLSMTQLTERIAVSKQQLTQLVDALVEKGLAERTGSEENRRLVLIGLTEEGRRLVEETVQKMSGELATFFEGFTPEEYDTVVQAARLVKRAMLRRLGMPGPQEIQVSGV